MQLSFGCEIKMSAPNSEAKNIVGSHELKASLKMFRQLIVILTIGDFISFT